MTVEMTSWKWHSGEFSLAEGRTGWNEERAAWGSPGSLLEIQTRGGKAYTHLHPLTRAPPPLHAPGSEEGKRRGRKKWKCILGRKNLQELVLYWLKQ